MIYDAGITFTFLHLKFVSNKQFWRKIYIDTKSNMTHEVLTMANLRNHTQIKIAINKSQKKK